MMSKFSLKARMLFSVGAVTLVAFGVLSVTVGVKAGDMARRQVTESTKNLVAHNAERVRASARSFHL